jgi:hypothetical protein
VRLSPLFGLLYQPRMIDDDDECGAVGEMRIGRGNGSTRRKPAPVPLCPPQIPHDLTRDRTRAATVGSWRPTAWTMTRPNKRVTGAHTKVYIKEVVNITLNDVLTTFYVNYYKYGNGEKLWDYNRQIGCQPLTAGTEITQSLWWLGQGLDDEGSIAGRGKIFFPSP